MFNNCVGEFCKSDKKRLVIVVDDLDRCDPSTVVEALASIRQFGTSATGTAPDCQFLVPCDEGQMVSAMEADGYLQKTEGTRYHNYSDSERLRKFFDVVLRMDEIVPESLAEFAASEAKKIDLPDELARDEIGRAHV